MVHRSPSDTSALVVNLGLSRFGQAADAIHTLTTWDLAKIVGSEKHSLRVHVPT